MATNTAGIPSPPDATFESTVQGLRHDPVTFVTGLVRTYGDIVRLPFGARDLYLLANPDFIRDMFIGKPHLFGKRKDVEAEAAYLNQIAVLAPLFDTQMTAGYEQVMTEPAIRMHDRWQAMHRQAGPTTVDMYKEMMRVLLEVVVPTLFQADATTDSAALVDAIVKMDVGYGFNPIEATLGEMMPPVNVPTAPEKEAARVQLLRFMQQQVDAQRDAPNDSRSLIPILVKFLSPEQVADQALQIMFAVHEVTVTTLAWTWYLLSQYPRAEAELHAELASVLAGRPPTYEDLPNLPYTYMVLNEARRLYPTVWIVGRFVRDDVSFDSYVVPAGSVVLASQWVMHHNERYFPNPDRFDPSRWTPEARAARPEFTFFPFSAGPRQCMGKDFAETEDALILATLAQHWQARLVPGQQLEPVPQKSSTPRHGILMTLHRR
jgi:cytochrome P450